MKMHNESRWWHQQSRNRVCDQYCGEIQDLVLIKTHIQISSLNNSLPLTSLQKPLDLGNELFGWWNKYLHKENISKGLDIWERLRKWEKWDKFVRLSVMFADAVGGPGVGIANVPPRGRPEGNMQNEMKTPTDLGEWLMQGRELKARHCDSGWGSQVSDEGVGIFNRCYLCRPVPAGFVNVKVGWDENFTKASLFALCLHHNNLNCESFR